MTSFPPEKPYELPVRFALINDLHTQFQNEVREHGGYRDAEARANWLFAQFEPGGSLSDLDFVQSAGDLVHGETLETIETELQGLAPRLQKFAMPFYPCCGNHEIKQSEGNAEYEAPYRKVYGEGAMDYSFPVGPLEVVVINNAGSFHVTLERRLERFKNLEALLSANPEKPKVLVCHIPLVPLRELDSLRPSFFWKTYRCLDLEILDLVDAYADRIPLVLSGHLHLTGRRLRRGVTHFVSAGLASIPHDFAIITLKPGVIEVETRSVPEELRRPETNIHGRPFHAVNYTDDGHPDHASYLRGRPEERKFSVPLSGVAQE